MWSDSPEVRRQNALFKQLSQHAGLELPITLITPQYFCFATPPKKKGTCLIRSLPELQKNMEWISRLANGPIQTEGWAPVGM